MPNPKTGTVTMDVKKAVSDVKGGKIDFKVDKTGIVHASVGKSSFTADKIKENAAELLNTILKLIPYTTKGEYVKSIFMTTPMSRSISLLTNIPQDFLKLILMTRDDNTHFTYTQTATMYHAQPYSLTDTADIPHN